MCHITLTQVATLMPSTGLFKIPIAVDHAHAFTQIRSKKLNVKYLCSPQISNGLVLQKTKMRLAFIFILFVAFSTAYALPSGWKERVKGSLASALGRHVCPYFCCAHTHSMLTPQMIDFREKGLPPPFRTAALVGRLAILMNSNKLQNCILVGLGRALTMKLLSSNTKTRSC